MAQKKSSEAGSRPPAQCTRSSRLPGRPASGEYSGGAGRPRLAGSPEGRTATAAVRERESGLEFPSAITLRAHPSEDDHGGGTVMAAPPVRNHQAMDLDAGPTDPRRRGDSGSAGPRSRLALGTVTHSDDDWDPDDGAWRPHDPGLGHLCTPIRLRSDVPRALAVSTPSDLRTS